MAKISRFATLQLIVNDLDDGVSEHWESNFPSPDFVSQVAGFQVGPGELAKFGRQRRATPVVAAAAIPDAVDVAEPDDLPAAIKAADTAVSEARTVVATATRAYADSRRAMSEVLKVWTQPVTPLQASQDYCKSELAIRAAAVERGAAPAATVNHASHLDRMLFSRFQGGPNSKDKGYGEGHRHGSYSSQHRGRRLMPPKVT